jgi:hypothetical protein
MGSRLPRRAYILHIAYQCQRPGTYSFQDSWNRQCLARSKSVLEQLISEPTYDGLYGWRSSLRIN